MTSHHETMTWPLIIVVERCSSYVVRDATATIRYRQS